MKPNEIEQWQKTRTKGRLHFVLVSGVLSWGLPMFIAMIFFVHRQELSLSYAAISFCLWVIVGGGAFGLVLWHVQESRFKKASGFISHE